MKLFLNVLNSWPSTLVSRPSLCPVASGGAKCHIEFRFKNYCELYSETKLILRLLMALFHLHHPSLPTSI